jgi:hypothetical protein
MKNTIKSVRTLAATLIMFGSLAGGANAAVITFNGTRPDGGGLTLLTTYTESGFVFTNTSGSNFFVDNDFPGAGIASIDDDSLANDGSATVFTLSMLGSSFNLNSLQHIGAFGASGIYSVNGTLAGGGTVSDTFSFVAGILNTHTFSAFTNVVSVQFTSAGGARPSALDNFNVSVTPVSEPSSTILFGLGALGIVAYRRSPRRARNSEAYCAGC